MKVAVRLLHVAVAVALVGLVVARSHPSELSEALGDVDLRLAALAALLNLPVLLLAPLRSHFVYRRLGYDIPARVLVPTTVLGFVAGGLTPAASGEVLRAGALRTRAGVAFEDSVVAVVYERALSMYLLALSTAALLVIATLSSTLAVLALIACACLYFVPWLVAVNLNLASKDEAEARGRVSSVVRHGLAMFGQVRLLLKDFGLLIRESLITAAMFSLVSLQYWLIARGISDGISVADAWLAFGISTLAAVVTLIPLGLGILDSSLAAVLDRLGMTLEQGAVVAILARAVILIPLVLAAFACYLYLQQISPKEREVQRPEAI